MSDIKSNEQIAETINKKITMLMLEQLPVPSCPLKRQQREWKIEEIKKMLIEKLMK